MAEYRPIVDYAGQWKELQDGDTLYTGTGVAAYLFLYRDYDGDSDAAKSDNPTDPVVLHVEDDVEYDDDFDWPDNIELNFENGSQFDVTDASKVVTIAATQYMSPGTQYFPGVGKVILFRNATAGQVHVEWWAGRFGSGSDDNHAFRQALESIEDGGVCNVGSGFWYIDDQLIGGYHPSVGSRNMITIRGVGADPDGAHYDAITYSGKGTIFVPSRTDSGVLVLSENTSTNVITTFGVHGLSPGDKVFFDCAMTPAAPIEPGRRYLVSETPSTTTFKIISEVDGSAVDILATSVGSVHVYRSVALWNCIDYFRNCHIENCSMSVQRSKYARCLDVKANTFHYDHSTLTPDGTVWTVAGDTGFNTSGTGLTCRNVTVHSYQSDTGNPTRALNRWLVDLNGGPHWGELVNLNFINCGGLAAGAYTNIYHLRSANLLVDFHQCTGTASTGGSLYDCEAWGWPKWTSSDERKGSPTYTLQPVFHRNLTLSFDASDRKLTSASPVFVPEDTSKNVVYIGGLPGAGTISSVDTGTETITSSAAHGLTVGDYIYFTTTGALPGGLSIDTPYWVTATPSSTTFRVSATLGGSNVNLTSGGSGTNTFVNPIECYISKVISPYEALVNSTSGGSDFTSQTVAVNSIAKNGTLGYAVFRFRGTGSTVSIDSGADEAFKSFGVWERGQFGGVFNITSRLVQSDFTFKAGQSFVNLNGPDLYSGHFNDLPGSWTITAVDTSTDVITVDSIHEFIPGQTVYFENTGGSLPSGLSASTPYYVIETPAPNKFKVSALYGGLSVNLTGAGSGTNTAVNPMGGGSVSINVDPVFLNKASLVNYLPTETPVLWQRRDGGSGLFKEHLWAENYDIDTTASVLDQRLRYPLPVTVYDPNPAAPSDPNDGAVLTIGHDSGDKNLLFIGVIDPVTKKGLYGLGARRDSSTGNIILPFSQVGFTLNIEIENGGLQVDQGLTSISSYHGIGFGPGAGGAITQGTSKATGVTLDKITGKITMHNAALAGMTAVTFRVTDNTILSTDTMIVNPRAGTIAAYICQAAISPTGGYVDITVFNCTAGSASEAVVLNFTTIRGDE